MICSSSQLTFGDLLKRYRVRAGLTQEALAERAGISLRGLSDLERGVRRAPYRDTVHRLAGGLGLGEAEMAALLTSRRRSGTTRFQPVGAGGQDPPAGSVMMEDSRVLVNTPAYANPARACSTTWMASDVSTICCF